MTTRPTSTFVISITAFDADGALDEGAQRAHLERMADAGVGVYLGGGGSGEGFTLDHREARRVLEIGVDAIGGRVPVRAMGTEPRTAAAMSEYLAMAADVGVDAAQVYSLDPGHGHRPTSAEVERYLRTVLSSTAIDCVVSSHMSVGYRLAPGLLTTLAAETPHLVGANCSHPDLGPLVALLDALGPGLSVHVGGPNQGLTALSLGASGFLSSEANLAPRTCAAVVGGFARGDLTVASDAFADLVRLSTLLYGLGGIRATKSVLRRLGLPGGFVRAPQFDADDAAVDRVMALLATTGIPAREGW